jgi:hypothetical protein
MNVDFQVRGKKGSRKSEDPPIPHGLVQPTWIRDNWPTVDISGVRNNMVVRIGLNNISIVPGGPSIQAELVVTVPAREGRVATTEQTPSERSTAPLAVIIASNNRGQVRHGRHGPDSVR